MRKLLKARPLSYQETIAREEEYTERRMLLLAFLVQVKQVREKLLEQLQLLQSGELRLSHWYHLSKDTLTADGKGKMRKEVARLRKKLLRLHKEPREVSAPEWSMLACELWMRPMRLERLRELRQLTTDSRVTRTFASLLEVRDSLICGHSRLAAWCAKKFRLGEMLELNTADLRSSAFLGLIKAVDAWIPKRSSKFSTYAVPCIRKGILKAIAREGHFIYCPKRKDYFAARSELAQLHGRKPTNEEIFERCGESIFLSGMPVEHLGRKANRLAEATLKDSTVDEFLRDLHQRKTLSIVLQDFLRFVPYRTQVILFMRYGLGDQHEYTFGEIGRVVKLTGGRVQQIATDILYRMQRPERIVELVKKMTLEDIDLPICRFQEDSPSEAS